MQDFLVKAKLLQKNSNCGKKKANIMYLEDGMYNSSHETESLSITTDDHNGRLKHYGILSTLMGEDF